MMPDLLTYEAAAALLTVSPATVRRLVRSGHLRGLAITRRCHRVDAASVRAYLRTSTIPVLISCPPGKTAIHGAGASCAAALSLQEALERAKRRLRRKPLLAPT